MTSKPTVWPALAACGVTILCLEGATKAAEAPNLFTNPSFEEVDAKGQPTNWLPIHFDTGGTCTVGTNGGRTGDHYVVLRATEDRNRSCYRQQVLWDDANTAVTAGGWYRTKGVEPGNGKGASIRFLFNSDPRKWEHLDIKTAFYEPREEWTPVQSTFHVPAGTRAVVIELFHWYTPGETHWDDVFVRTAKEDEMPTEWLSATEAVDRDPVHGRNLPYSPADGETVQLNPPPFRWLPSGAGATYRLQIDRDATFGGDDLLAFEGSEWCCEMLTKPLTTGTWYWRYGVDKGPYPTVWSKARRFDVPAGATPWPYPGRDSFSVPKERPHLFVKPDELPELRRRAKEGDLKSVAQGLVNSVRNYAGDDLVPEPDFLPKDPAKRGPAYTLTFRATRPPMDRMEQAALAYLLTGNAECGAEAKRRILHFFSWDPKGSTDVFHNDEPAMWVMMRGVRAYDWTYRLFTAEERAEVEACMRIRAAEFYRLMRRKPFENNPFESHAGRIIGFLGEAALELLNEVPEAREWLDYITKIYWGVYPAWGKDDGGWNEGPGYWGAYMSFGLHFVLALRQATGIDLSKRPFFQNTPYYRLYLTPPHSTMSPFGDGTQWKPSRPAELMYWFSTLTQDPRIRWYADYFGRNGGSSILGIVLKDDSLKSMPPYDLPQARLFEGVGLVSMHTDLANGDEDVHFAMRSSPYGAVSHGHNDQNCFVLEAFGEPLAIATGYYNRYGSPHHAGWTRQTQAKCGITHDGGKGQDRGWGAQGEITSFVHGEKFDLVIGDATKAYGGRLTRALREVVHVRPGIFVIRDDLASDEPRKFEFQLHALDEMEVDEVSATVVTKRPKATLTTRFLVPTKPVFTQTDQFTVPPTWPPDVKYENNWHVTAAQPELTTEAEFLTVLLPARVGEEGSLPEVRYRETSTARGVEIKFADGSHTLVAFRRPGVEGPMEIEKVVSDGRVHAWHVTGKRTLGGMATLLCGGTELLDADEPLIRCGSPATVTVAYADDGGRVDTAGSPGEVSIVWDMPAPTFTRGDERVNVRTDAQGNPPSVAFSTRAGRDSLTAWRGRQPSPPGEISVGIRCDGTTHALRGVRFGRGNAAVSGRLGVPAGAYRLRVPEGVSLATGAPRQDDVLWLRGNDNVSLKGTSLPNELSLEPVVLAAKLPAKLQRDLPEGIAYEAEANWRETGGKIQVSGGGHDNVSGGDNLWGWNTAGHTLFWDIEVKDAGRYHVWFVGATQTGLLAELRLDDGDSLALWFERTGGWGRKVADEWRAFQVAGVNDQPAVFDLSAGKHRLALTNWMGMGLNVDRLVLVPAG